MKLQPYKAELFLKHDRGLGPTFIKTVRVEAENIIDARMRALDFFSEEYGATLLSAPIFVEPVVVLETEVAGGAMYE